MPEDTTQAATSSATTDGKEATTAQTKPEAKDNDLKTYSTAELNQMFEDRLKRDREAREKELGMSTKEAKAILKARKDAEEAEKTALQKATEKAEAAEKALKDRDTKDLKRSKVEDLIANKKIKLPDGVSISDVLGMIDGQDENGITEGAAKLTKFFPFNATMGSGSNPANLASKTPNIDEQIALAEANGMKTGNYDLATQLKLKKQRELYPNM
jgi:hypothetical protein